MVRSVSVESLSTVKVVLPASLPVKKAQRKVIVPITFGLSGQEAGKSVEIAGSFNEWKPALTQYNPSNGLYEFVYDFDMDLLDTETGANSENKSVAIFYKYIVDGEWRVNENVETVKDALGNVNNALWISAVTDEVTLDESVVDLSIAPKKRTKSAKGLIAWIKSIFAVKSSPRADE